MVGPIRYHPQKPLSLVICGPSQLQHHFNTISKKITAQKCFHAFCKQLSFTQSYLTHNTSRLFLMILLIVSPCFIKSCPLQIQLIGTGEEIVLYHSCYPTYNWFVQVTYHIYSNIGQISPTVGMGKKAPWLMIAYRKISKSRPAKPNLKQAKSSMCLAVGTSYEID